VRGLKGPGLALGVGLASLLPAPAACAAEGEALPSLNLSEGVASSPVPPLGTYLRAFGELSLGKGLHANNPYRLGTSDALGFTATYLNLGLGVAFGPPDFLQHGAELSLAVATDGIAQQVLTPSYVALFPLGERALLKGRLGVPLVLDPDPTLGIEAAIGGVWLVTGGIGAKLELVSSLFYGAATPERSLSTIPIFALELGLFFDHEVLP
jgi:hypothetical protein